MIDSSPTSERIYVAQIKNSPDPTIVGMFALHHYYQQSPEHSEVFHVRYDFNRPTLEGYLAGATTIRMPHVRLIQNGIKPEMREGFFPDIELDIIPAALFLEIAENAGLIKKIREGSVNFVP